MPSYLQAGSASEYRTRGATYRASTAGLIVVPDAARADVLDLVACGCKLLDATGPGFYRLVGNPGQVYVAEPSGVSYTADVNGLMLITASAGGDATNLVTQYCTLAGVA